MMGWLAVNCRQMEQRLSSSLLQAETDPITGIQQGKPCDSGPHPALFRLRWGLSIESCKSMVPSICPSFLPVVGGK